MNVPAIGDVFFISNASTNFDIYKLEVTNVNRQACIIKYKVWRSLLQRGVDLGYDDSYGEISLSFWYNWLDSGAMTKIGSPQEELAYILKYGDNL